LFNSKLNGRKLEFNTPLSRCLQTNRLSCHWFSSTVSLLLLKNSFLFVSFQRFQHHPVISVTSAMNVFMFSSVLAPKVFSFIEIALFVHTVESRWDVELIFMKKIQVPVEISKW